jgi:UDP:flavonoid glycosyltransferase YjiC (YdhE family)
VKVLVCPMSEPGYLYPGIAVGLALQGRGHEVCVLARPSRFAGLALSKAGLRLLPAEDFGGLDGFSTQWWHTEKALDQYEAVLRASRAEQADIILTSVLCHGVLLAAEVLDLPVVVLGYAVHLSSYASGPEEPLQAKGERAIRVEILFEKYAGLREQAGLARVGSRWPGSPLYGSALLLRGNPVLEHPGAVLPPQVHHVGPCAWEPAADKDVLDAVRARLQAVGKPVVYVHLSRYFDEPSPWPRLNAAFTDSPFQAVVEQGRSSRPEPAADADIVLVRQPWMGPLIEEAGLVMTNGTSSPVLNGLLRGRPLVMTPRGSEQPVLTNACLRAGVAMRVTEGVIPDLRTTLDMAWGDTALRERAEDIGRRLAGMDSAERAADIVEKVFSG